MQKSRSGIERSLICTSRARHWCRPCIFRGNFVSIAPSARARSFVSLSRFLPLNFPLILSSLARELAAKASARPFSLTFLIFLRFSLSLCFFSLLSPGAPVPVVSIAFPSRAEFFAPSRARRVREIQFLLCPRCCRLALCLIFHWFFYSVASVASALHTWKLVSFIDVK